MLKSWHRATNLHNRVLIELMQPPVILCSPKIQEIVIQLRFVYNNLYRRDS